MDHIPIVFDNQDLIGGRFRPRRGANSRQLAVPLCKKAGDSQKHEHNGDGLDHQVHNQCANSSLDDDLQQRESVALRVWFRIVRADWFRRLTLIAMVWLVACTPARREIDPSINVVRNIHFDGNGGPYSGHNDLQLRQQMETDGSAFGLLIWPLMYIVEPEPLDPDLLPKDAYRLEVWYAHHGYFDAQVLGWKLHRVRRPKKHRSGVLDVRGVVDTGAPSLVDNLNIHGLDSPALKLFAGVVRRRGYLHEGDIFNLEYAQYGADLLQEVLRNHGYAYASVDLDVHARTEEQRVEVNLQAEAGISSRVGPVRVTGNEDIPETFIHEVLRFKEGDAYKLENLTGSQQDLFNLGTFSIVQINPDLSDPTNPDVPIEVSVDESKWRSFRFGIGTDIENRRLFAADASLSDGLGLSPRASATFTHQNVFRQLVQNETIVSAGFDYVLSAQGTTFTETFGVQNTTTFTRIGGRTLSLDVAMLAQQDVYMRLWAFRRISVDIPLQWHPSERVSISVGPHVERYEYLFETTAQVNSARRVFGQDFVNPYLLTALDQNFVYDKRIDNPTTGSTTRGRYLSLGLREAFPLTPEGNAYFGIQTDTRLYAPIRLTRQQRSYPVSLAWALRTDTLFPTGDTPIPYAERAFLGGANTIRGFRTGTVGPYEALCSYDDIGEPVNDNLPYGGTISIQSSFEVRYPWINGITFASFVDAGILAEDAGSISSDLFRASAGVGARYDTLVGPVRFDVSFRPLYPEDQGPEKAPTCTDSAEGARVYDLFSAFPKFQQSGNRPPFAMVFYLAIGEAI